MTLGRRLTFQLSGEIPSLSPFQECAQPTLATHARAQKKKLLGQKSVSCKILRHTFVTAGRSSAAITRGRRLACQVCCRTPSLSLVSSVFARRLPPIRARRTGNLLGFPTHVRPGRLTRRHGLDRQLTLHLAGEILLHPPPDPPPLQGGKRSTGNSRYRASSRLSRLRSPGPAGGAGQGIRA
jgi:hypothetical protein